MAGELEVSTDGKKNNAAPFEAGLAGTFHCAESFTTSLDEVHQLSSHQPSARGTGGLAASGSGMPAMVWSEDAASGTVTNPE